MMPLTFASVGEENMIRKVGGNSEIRAHLENLGFVTGGNVTVVSTIGGNLIVNVVNLNLRSESFFLPAHLGCFSIS